MKQANKPKVLRIINSGVLCLALMFILMELGQIASGESGSTVYFGLALLSMSIHNTLAFCTQQLEAKSKWNYAQLGYAAVCLAAMVCAFVIHDTSRLYVLPSALFLLTLVIRRVLLVIGKRKGRSKLYQILMLILLLLFLLGTIATSGADVGSYRISSIFADVLIMLYCLGKICSIAFSQFNKDVLLNIVHKTYAGEILTGLLLLVVAFSLVLMHNEESIHSFDDALWYCFAVITTIGFGDIAAVSLVGRILTVILGLYGIVAVAILTSIIINFYSEVKDKNDDESIDAAPETISDAESPNDSATTESNKEENLSDELETGEQFKPLKSETTDE